VESFSGPVSGVISAIAKRVHPEVFTWQAPFQDGLVAHTFPAR